MHSASYPKETPHQWPPEAGERSGRRAACNQSINIGGSLGERSNLMSHTHRERHTSPLYLTSSFLPSAPLWILFFLSAELWPLGQSLYHPVTQCPPLLSLPVLSLPHRHLPRSRGTGHKRQECSGGRREMDEDGHKDHKQGRRCTRTK